MGKEREGKGEIGREGDNWVTEYYSTILLTEFYSTIRSWWGEILLEQWK